MDERIRYEGSAVIIDGTKYPVVDSWYGNDGTFYQCAEESVCEDLSDYHILIDGEDWYTYCDYQDEPERSDVERSCAAEGHVTAMTPAKQYALQHRMEYVERELERLGKEKIVLIDLLRTGRRLSVTDIKEITVIDRSLDGTYDIQLRIEDGTKRYGEIYDYISYNPETRFIDEDISLETRLGDESVERLKDKLDELIRKGA